MLTECKCIREVLHGVFFPETRVNGLKNAVSMLQEY